MTVVSSDMKKDEVKQNCFGSQRLYFFKRKFRFGFAAVLSRLAADPLLILVANSQRPRGIITADTRLIRSGYATNSQWLRD